MIPGKGERNGHGCLNMASSGRQLWPQGSSEYGGVFAYEYWPIKLFFTFSLGEGRMRRFMSQSFSRFYSAR